MDQSEHRTRWPHGQRVANGGSVGNSLALGPTAPTPNRAQVHSRFNSLDLRWQRRVHVRHCYPPRELANGEFETRFCNVCPIWRWPDIVGNALTWAGRAASHADKDVTTFLSTALLGCARLFACEAAMILFMAPTMALTSCVRAASSSQTTERS